MLLRRISPSDQKQGPAQIASLKPLGLRISLGSPHIRPRNRGPTSPQQATPINESTHVCIAAGNPHVNAGEGFEIKLPRLVVGLAPDLHSFGPRRRSPT